MPNSIGLVPFLFGLYCARINFRVWKFCLGFALASLVTTFLFYGSSPPLLRLIVRPLSFLVLSVVALSLPLQRQAFERLLRFSLGAAPGEPETRDPMGKSFFAGLVEHGSLVILAVAVAFAAAFGCLERKHIRTVSGGVSVAHVSLALRNAYDDFKGTGFTTRGEGPKTKGKMPDYVAAHLTGPVPPALADEAVAMVRADAAAVEYLTDNPAVAILERAVTADYCGFLQESGEMSMPGFVLFRETAQTLALRATMRMSEGKPDEALRDIETILRTGWLLHDDCGTLVTEMVGSAVRSVGLATAQSYYLRFLDEPEELAKLAETLKHLEPQVRMSMNIEKIRRSEPGLWTFAAYFEITVPGFLRAFSAYYATWAQYDFLVLALALEKYKGDSGSYPGKIQELMPKYLERLPLDPLTGGSYVYQLADSEFTLHRPPPGEKGSHIGEEGPWSLPASKVDCQELRKSLKKRKDSTGQNEAER